MEWLLDQFSTNPLVQLAALALSIALLVWASGHRKQRQAVSLSPPRGTESLSRPHVPSIPPVTSSMPLLRRQNWLSDVVSALHVLIVGQTRAGKTVLTHEIAMQRVARSEQVLVCDPDARPGMWPGCAVYGGGDDWDMIEQVLQSIKPEIEARRAARTQGAREFPPITLVLSELSDIVRYCPTVRDIFETILRRGGKIGIKLLADVQDSQVKTLDIPGASKLLQNFHARVEVRREGDRRIAQIGEVDYLIPELTDPEDLADTHAARHGATQIRQKATEMFPSPKTDFPASGSDFDVSSLTFSHAEIVKITARIARGETKTEIVRSMPHYASRRHGEFAAVYDQLKAAYDEAELVVMEK